MLLEGREIKKSTRKNKKYMVKVGTRWIHWGDSRYQQYKDMTPLKAYSYLDHGDAKRRALYHQRHKHTKDPSSAAYWGRSSLHGGKYLW